MKYAILNITFDCAGGRSQAQIRAAATAGTPTGQAATPGHVEYAAAVPEPGVPGSISRRFLNAN